MGVVSGERPASLVSSMPGAVVLRLENADVGFPGTPVLKDLSLEIRRGEWVSLIGPNGSGKTTLLKSLLGILPLLSGTRSCTESALGYAPQRFRVPGDTKLTVAEFLALRRVPKNTPGPQAGLEELGLGQWGCRALRSLSGGQLQKVLLAFALRGSPSILFLDEYLEGVDPRARTMIDRTLERMKTAGKTVIEVSHDLTAVSRLADRVILFQSEGICYDGAPRGDAFHHCLHDAYGGALLWE